MENIGCIWNSKRTFSRFYNPLKYLATDKVTAHFKGRLIFRLHIPSNTSVLTSKFTNSVTPMVTCMTWKSTWRKTDNTSHDTALDSNSHHSNRTGEKTERHGHKLYMDSLFSFLKLVNELTKKKITCFGTVGLNMEGLPKDLRCMTVKLRW